MINLYEPRELCPLNAVMDSIKKSYADGFRYDIAEARAVQTGQEALNRRPEREERPLRRESSL